MGPTDVRVFGIRPFLRWFPAIGVMLVGYALLMAFGVLPMAFPARPGDYEFMQAWGPRLVNCLVFAAAVWQLLRSYQTIELSRLGIRHRYFNKTAWIAWEAAHVEHHKAKRQYLVIVSGNVRISVDSDYADFEQLKDAVLDSIEPERVITHDDS